MADPPKWDYWLYEDLGDGRYLSIYHDRSLPEGDVRNNKYDVDIKKWCRKYLWNAEQAALISFIRDPDKVTAADLRPQDDEFGDFKEHNELWNNMSKLCDLITDAQKKRILPDIFPPGMYIEWARHVGVDMPLAIRKELEIVERERRYEADDSAEPSDDVAAVALKHAKKNGASQQKRFENGLTRTLLAVLIKSALIKTDTATLSKALADILDAKAQKGDGKFSLGAATIKKRLDEAHDHLK
jgi:hypothetical protein